MAVGEKVSTARKRKTTAGDEKRTRSLKKSIKTQTKARAAERAGKTKKATRLRAKQKKQVAKSNKTYTRGGVNSKDNTISTKRKGLFSANKSTVGGSRGKGAAGKATKKKVVTSRARHLG